MKVHFQMMAAYNEWANEKLYAMAKTLPDADYRKDVGAYFGSLHGTLNHLLTADRIWLRRLTGTGDHPDALDAVLFEDLGELHQARQEEDRRLSAFVDALDAAQFEWEWEYRTLNGRSHLQPLYQLLGHIFNHQTHHRGQAHTILTILGLAEPDPLDLLYMLRERG